MLGGFLKITHTHAEIDTHTNAHIHAHTHTPKHAPSFFFLHTQTNTHTCTYTHTTVHTNTHMTFKNPFSRVSFFAKETSKSNVKISKFVAKRDCSFANKAHK